MFSASYAKAQVSIEVGIGSGYDYVGAAPICSYGYYDYYPYECAPYGFYGPDYFVGDVFIGAGPWYRGYYGRGGYRYYGRGREYGRGFDNDRYYSRGNGYYGRGRGYDRGYDNGGYYDRGNGYYGNRNSYSGRNNGNYGRGDGNYNRGNGNYGRGDFNHGNSRTWRIQIQP